MVWIVSRETEARLATYVDCLRRWNPTINLMSARDLSEFWPRHMSDGLAIGSMLTQNPGTVADLGSGAGIPGLVAAISTGKEITLVEADRRKAAFLNEAARITGARVIVMPVRVEHAALRDITVVTARALAPLDRLLALSLPILAPGGCGLFIKGADAAIEIETARRRFDFVLERHHLAGSVILRVSSIALKS